MLDKTKPVAALFDLDGVIIDTETQYTSFWGDIFKKYLGDESLSLKVKGTTLSHIYSTFFPGQEETTQKITAELLEFEKNMNMNYIPGLQDFVADLNSHGVKTAIVTSSNMKKIQFVCDKHPEIKTMFSKIFTAEDFARSKPFPDPYLTGTRYFDTVCENCFVFEDSFNGLKSGRAAEMNVVALATTNPVEKLLPLADIVINDFVDFSYEKLLEVTKKG